MQLPAEFRGEALFCLLHCRKGCVAQCLTQECGWASDNVSVLPISQIKGGLSVYLSAIDTKDTHLGGFRVSARSVQRWAKS